MFISNRYAYKTKQRTSPMISKIETIYSQRLFTLSIHHVLVDCSADCERDPMDIRGASKNKGCFMVTSLIARFMGPIWGRQDPGGPHVGPMNFAVWSMRSMREICNAMEGRKICKGRHAQGRYAKMEISRWISANILPCKICWSPYNLKVKLFHLRSRTNTLRE